MNYRESRPSPRFAGLVRCFWALDDESRESAAEPEPVLPDGCIEIIFNLSDRFRRHHPTGEVETQPAGIVAGQMQQSVLIGPSGNVRLFGIRFEPAGAFPFFDFDLNHLLNRIEPLDAIWGIDVANIEDRLAATDEFDLQVRIVERELTRRVSERRVADPWLRHAIDMIGSGNGMLPIGTLAKNLGVSERGIERRFTRFVGIPPKTFSRIVRFQRVLRSLQSDPKPEILDTALSFGYYDQSHLISDFRQFSGATPSAFLESAHRMTEVFMSAE